MIAVAATQNKHKIEEMQAMTRDFGIELVSLADVGLENIDIVEDGDTFEENSEKKAREIMKLCGKIAIADDSGLMVNFLGGAPGVYSARFSGPEADDEQNNQKLLHLLEQVEFADRQGAFVSVITMVYPDGSKLVARGECSGHILKEARGPYGFGYDPLFQPLGYEQTFGELSAAEKNKISHRAKALQRLKELLAEKEI